MCEPCGDLPTLPVITAAKKTKCLRGRVVWSCGKPNVCGDACDDFQWSWSGSGYLRRGPSQSRATTVQSARLAACQVQLIFRSPLTWKQTGALPPFGGRW